jgi:micrococcal nuclease
MTRKPDDDSGVGDQQKVVRRMMQRQMVRVRWLLLLAATAALLAGCDIESLATPTVANTNASTTPTVAADMTLTRAQVRRVVDGDTIIVVLDGREERLRYIGVDTPESVSPSAPVECYGREAAEANRRLVEGRSVYLEKDVSERDRYGRLLRYVFVDDPAGGGRLFVNLELVRQGYAQVVTFPPDVRHAGTFRAAQQEARDAELGLWGAC